MLQMLLFVEASVEVPWLLAHVACLVLRPSDACDSGDEGSARRWLSLAASWIAFPLSLPRLMIGFVGNLMQRPPLLLAFWLLTLLLQLPSLSLLLATGVECLPLVLMDGCLWSLLLLQSLVGVMAVRACVLRIPLPSSQEFASRMQSGSR